ncbi:hypothetical protein L218DRAFT_854748 [Marasmius fiardii PR-910]|nr:hypothetical protein L218DRAFT_854748 [Marasmius fiardii PR-910]
MSQSLDQIHPSVAPIHTTTGVNHPNRSGIHSNSANSPIGTSPSSASSFSSHNSGAGASNSTLSSLPTSEASGASESTNCNNKRTRDPSSQSSTSKRHRASPPSTSGTTTKSSLLSPSQKKANHIQSEQKRRANIRRGYEALCETVPALREAIRQEETQQTSGVDGSKGSVKARRGRGRGKVDEGTGEKIDGRAGPRSENIVLSKTIEYINELLKDRETLLGRLHRIKLSLGPNHPSNLNSNSGPPLWERVWTGGSGKDADAEDEEEEEDGDE